MDRGVFPALHARGDRLAHERCSPTRRPDDDTPLVAIRQLAERGGTAVLTYTPHRLHSFARTTAVLDQMGLNVVDARLITSANGFSLETYVVLEDNGAVIADPARIGEIERGLWRNLKQPEDSPLTVTRRAPRQVRMFSTPTQVNFSLDNRNNRTILELVAADRPGLLSEVGKVFKTERVAINGAKIMTVGERAEDVFYITDMDGRVLLGGGLPAGAGLAGAGARPARGGDERELDGAIARDHRGRLRKARARSRPATPPRSCARRSRAAVGMLDAGSVRVAEKRDGGWQRAISG